jgi:hypothetical protein
MSCLGTIVLRGTLVIMAPSKDGLVAAADSRIINVPTPGLPLDEAPS